MNLIIYGFCRGRKHMGTSGSQSARMAGYTSGAFGLSLFYNIMVLYLFYFYTDVFGITAAAAGTMFLVSRIWDGVNDPIMGAVVDRTRSRMGKFGPYILFGTIPLAIVTVLIFNPLFPDMTMGQKILYAYVTYILFGMLNTLVGIPYNSIQASITKNQKTRVRVVLGVRVFDMLGALVVAVLAFPLVRMLGGDNESLGFGRLSVIVASAAVLVLFASYGASSRLIISSYKRDIETQSEKNSIAKSISVVKNNTPLLIIGISLFLSLTATVVRQGSIIYYFIYNAGNEQAMPLFNLLTLGCTALSMLIVPLCTDRLGKKRTALYGAAVYLTGNILLFAAPPSSLILVYLFGMLGSIGTGITFVAVMSMLPDTVEYGEWKTGVRSEAVIYSIYSFIQKLSMAAAGALAGFLLTVSGYQAHTVQTPEALWVIRSMLALFPAAAAVIGFICILNYDLTEERYTAILQEIQERKTASGVSG